MDNFDYSEENLQSQVYPGYNSAITYYANLREQLLDKLNAQLQSTNKKLANEAEKFFDNNNKDLKRITETYYAQSAAMDMYEAIQEGIAAKFQEITGEQSSRLKELYQENMEKAKTKTKAKDRLKSNFYDQNKLARKQVLRELGIDIDSMNEIDFLNTLLMQNEKSAKALSNISGFEAESYNDIYNNLLSFLDRVIASYATIDVKSPNAYGWKYTMGGYYKELAEAKLLAQFFNKFDKIKVVPFGSQKVNSKDTEIDIAILTDNIKNIADVLKTRERVILQLNDEVDDKALKDIVKEIDTFGVQVKSWNMPSDKTSKYASFKIGGRKLLLNNPYPESWFRGAVWLSKVHNILKVLGSLNVIFIACNKKIWMCDFIQHFRDTQYYLAYIYKKGHKSTDNIAWQKYRKAHEKLDATYLT